MVVGLLAVASVAPNFAAAYIAFAKSAPYHCSILTATVKAVARSGRGAVHGRALAAIAPTRLMKPNVSIADLAFRQPDPRTLVRGFDCGLRGGGGGGDSGCT